MTRNFADNHATASVGIGVTDGKDNLFASQLIRDTEGAAMLGVSKATWWRRVADGTVPRPLKIGGTSRWKRSDVEAVIELAAAQRASH